MRIVPALIIAVAIVIGALLVILIPLVMQGPGAITGSAVDSGARIDIELMRGDVDALKKKVEELESQISNMSFNGQGVAPLGPGSETTNNGPNTIIDQYAQVVNVADRRNINNGLTVAPPSWLIEKLGAPREELTEQCQDMTNPRLSGELVTEDVGPIRVKMLKPAVDSLRRVFAKIEAADKDLYDRINTAGSLCVRLIRGSESAISTHAFGLAVDLNIDGTLDTLGDGKTQLGLTILADFFNAEGWVWGASFGREDSMHFEVGEAQLEQWIADGVL
jgi:hypothetical protein